MRTLAAKYPAEDWSTGLTPFEILVSTVLSQSTTAANERRGMDGLRAAFGRVIPETLATADVESIARAIWHAGLARVKAPRLRGIARAVRDTWGGDLDRALGLPTDEARAALVALPGVGPKTADVVLAMAGGHPAFPVDTHVARIARRWRIPRGGAYADVRAALERWTPPTKRKTWHLVLIAHGRALCKARAPRCDACPVAPDCDWFRARARRPRSKRLRADGQ